MNERKHNFKRFKIYETADGRQVIARCQYEAGELLGESKGYSRNFISALVYDKEGGSKE